MALYFVLIVEHKQEVFDRVLAPGKINIGLKVGAKSQNGLHKIDSYLVLIPIYDEINIAINKSGRISIEGKGYLKDNVVDTMEKAILLYKKESGLEFGVDIIIKKNIPLSSGLGGESSDASTVFKYLNNYFKVFSDDKALNLSFSLGSDVPFFYSGYKIAHVFSYGEKVKEVKKPFPFKYVYIVPFKKKESTKTQYETLDKINRDYFVLPQFVSPFNRERYPNDFERLFSSQDIEKVKSMYNLNDGYLTLSGSGGTLIYLTNQILSEDKKELNFLKMV